MPKRSSFMKSLRRYLLVLFASFLFVTSTLTVNVFAEDGEKTVEYGSITYVNPLYEGVVKPEKVDYHDPRKDASYDTYTAVEDAAVALRSGMVAREEVIRFYFSFTSDETNWETDTNTYWRSILRKATEHTGNPKEGDNLQWQYGSMSSGEMSGSISGNQYTFLFTYVPAYYTTAAQESELDSAVYVS